VLNLVPTMENARRIPSRRASRSGSRPNSPPLHRLLSNQFPDDHSVYHHEEGEGTHVKGDAASLHKTETQRRTVASSDDDDSMTETKEREQAAGEQETTYEEIRGGIPYEHDVEAEAPQLEKQKSNRSTRDPNLVSFTSRAYIFHRD
jgi:hypothetical protein